MCLSNSCSARSGSAVRRTARMGGPGAFIPAVVGSRWGGYGVVTMGLETRNLLTQGGFIVVEKVEFYWWPR
jgi:hypothetical protein